MEDEFGARDEEAALGKNHGDSKCSNETGFAYSIRTVEEDASSADFNVVGDVGFVLLNMFNKAMTDSDRFDEGWFIIG